MAAKSEDLFEIEIDTFNEKRKIAAISFPRNRS